MPSLVGALHHRAGDVQVGDVGAEQDARSGLDVGADLDHQIGEAFEAVVVSHVWQSRTRPLTVSRLAAA